MRRISPAGRAYLKGFESLRLSAYPDTNGTWTIGYGHTGHDVARGIRWTRGDAEAAFDRDLYDVEFAVSNALKEPAEQWEFDAICCLVFNIGITNFMTSTLLRKFNAGDKVGAASEFSRWNKETIKGKLVVSRGLTQRRAAERSMFLGGAPTVVGEKKAAPSEEQPLTQSAELPREM